MPLHRGDHRTGFTLSVRYAYGGPLDGQAYPSGYFGFAYEAWYHHQPQQVHPRSSGSGKSLLLHQPPGEELLWSRGDTWLLVDTGNSYRGLCSLVNGRTHGGDGIYITYEEDNPIAFNPFHTASGEFDVEKRESIKTLILTLWKREDEAPKRSEEVALSGAVNATSAG